MKAAKTTYRAILITLGYILTFATTYGIGLFAIYTLITGEQTGWFPYREVAAFLAASFMSFYVFRVMIPGKDE